MIEWKSTDMCQELCNFGIKVRNILMTNNYNTQEGGTQIIQTLKKGFQSIKCQIKTPKGYK